MEVEQVIQGRLLRAQDLQLIRHWLATEPGLSSSE
jgi:hypothetical protein